MLTLSRSPNESILLSNGIRITLVQIKGEKARIQLDLPREVIALRDELIKAGETFPQALTRLNIKHHRAQLEAPTESSNHG